MYSKLILIKRTQTHHRYSSHNQTTHTKVSFLSKMPKNLASPKTYIFLEK